MVGRTTVAAWIPPETEEPEVFAPEETAAAMAAIPVLAAEQTAAAERADIAAMAVTAEMLLLLTCS